MRLRDTRVLLTGASGGIGRQLALRLAERGARLALVGRREHALREVAEEVGGRGAEALAIAADITRPEGREAAVDGACRGLGGVDVLINNAGASEFGEFATSDPAVLEEIFRTNTLAPVLLTRAVLPEMIRRGSGRIVNVGSIFGSIGFAYFTAYSSNKFALRGFSESLRRELEGTGVGVTYVAPRATRTPLNSGAVYRMAAAVKMAMDDPSDVAGAILEAIERDVKDRYLGWPERLFVRVNAVLPRLVDRALRRQNGLMRGFATRS
jgi:short-subunit dehydrogenase